MKFPSDFSQLLVTAPISNRYMSSKNSWKKNFHHFTFVIFCSTVASVPRSTPYAIWPMARVHVTVSTNNTSAFDTRRATYILIFSTNSKLFDFFLYDTILGHRRKHKGPLGLASWFFLNKKITIGPP